MQTAVSQVLSHSAFDIIYALVLFYLLYKKRHVLWYTVCIHTLYIVVNSFLRHLYTFVCKNAITVFLSRTKKPYRPSLGLGRYIYMYRYICLITLYIAQYTRRLDSIMYKGFSDMTWCTLRGCFIHLFSFVLRLSTQIFSGNCGKTFQRV